MADSIAKGDDLFQKAQKKLKGFAFFGNKYEEAAELLEKAANYFKLGKAWKEAAAAYDQLAEVQVKLDSKHDAANAYVEGAKCAMKAAPGSGVAMLQRAVDIYTDMGRLNMAARQLKEIAEAQEKQGQKQDAIEFYTKAADLFALENSSSEANKCMIKVAEMSADLDRFDRAQSIYEDVARASVENNLLKYSAKGYLLQFAGSREDMLLSACATALASADERAFATAVAEFDALTRLDAWKTNMLLKVKRRLQSRAAGEEPGVEDDEEVL